ncbi:hypothetical protein LJC59_03830 [Desulfovibrio sp. OttesenSCG-928-A18]|nr:hypothetical protein [Desulfovibrio sp. OttesenSCG-928-A18]
MPQRFTTWLFGLFGVCVLAGMIFAGHARAQKFFLKKNSFAIFTEQGESLIFEDDEVGSFAIRYAPGRYVTLDKQRAARAGLEPCIVLFNAKSEYMGHFPFAEAASCRDLTLSPDGRVLAVDAGSEAVRRWYFFSYPFFIPLGEAHHAPGQGSEAESPAPFFWTGDHAAVIAIFQDRPERECGSEPCGSTSVLMYDALRGQSTIFAQGTELCDSTPVTVEAGKLHIQSQCVARVKDWSKENSRRTVKRQIVELGDFAVRNIIPPAPKGQPRLSTDPEDQVKAMLEDSARTFLLSDLFCETRTSDGDVDSILQGIVWRFGVERLREFSEVFVQAAGALQDDLESILADESQKGVQEKQCQQWLKAREQALLYFAR